MPRLNLWFLPPAFFSAGGPWVRPAPGIPCALVFRGWIDRHSSDATRAARSRKHVPGWATIARATGRCGRPERCLPGSMSWAGDSQRTRRIRPPAGAVMERRGGPLPVRTATATSRYGIRCRISRRGLRPLRHDQRAPRRRKILPAR